jgi:hypothetical protein
MEEMHKLTLDTKESVKGVQDLTKETGALNAVLDTLNKNQEETAKGFNEFYKSATVTTSELDTLSRKIVTVADEGEAGAGFGGLAKNVWKAERVMDIFTHPDKGLARAAPMLESVAKALGMTSGVGFAITGLIFAFETLAPHLKGFFEQWDAEKIKGVSDELTNAIKAAEALEATPTMTAKTTAERVSKAIVARPGGAPQLEADIALQLGPLEQFMAGSDAELIRQYQRQQASPQARMEAAMHGQALISEQDVMAATERARTARATQAKAFVGQLGTSRETRETLRGMRGMERGFLTELGMAEPEYQAEMKQTIAAETAAGHEMQTTRNHMKADIKKKKEADET